MSIRSEIRAQLVSGRHLWIEAPIVRQILGMAAMLRPT